MRSILKERASFDSLPSLLPVAMAVLVACALAPDRAWSVISTIRTAPVALNPDSTDSQYQCEAIVDGKRKKFALTHSFSDPESVEPGVRIHHGETELDGYMFYTRISDEPDQRDEVVDLTIEYSTTPNGPRNMLITMSAALRQVFGINDLGQFSAWKQAKIEVQLPSRTLVRIACFSNNAPTRTKAIPRETSAATSPSIH